MRFRTRRLVHFALALAATVAAAAVPLVYPSTVGVALGLIACFVLPGYALTRLLWRGRELTWFEQLMCVPALSAVTIVLSGLIVYALGYSLTKATWTYVLAGVTIVALSADVVLRRHEEAAPPRRRWTRRDALAIGCLALVAAILTVTAVLGYRSARQDQPGAATSLSMVQALASEAPGPVRTVSLGVWNGEGKRITFTIRITGSGGFTHTVDADVYAQSHWSAQVSVPSTGKVVAELFRPGDSAPYRAVFEDEP